jgi:class 3 adenylate cyclase
MAERTCEIGILFADIAGSTRLYEVLGDEPALRTISACLTTMSGVISQHGGSVVKTIGDEVMAAFPEPRAMFDAAVAMQRTVSTLPPLVGPEGTVRLHVRIGLHFGPAIIAGEDLYGDTVNIAARMVAIARADQIIMASDCASLLRGDQRQETRSLTVFPVKGRTQATHIVEVLWHDAPGTTVIESLRKRSKSAKRVQDLRLSYGGVDHVFDGQGEIGLGRGPANQIVVPHHRVSRKHATIGLRRDKWVLTDHSTNGTFVTFAGEPELPLHIDELVLYKSGVIALGLPAEAGGECVHFKVVAAPL